jgi:hypothetical protein
MANIFTNKLNDREFLDTFGVESPMTPEELAALSQEQEVVSEPVISPVQNTPKPTPKDTASTNPFMEGVPDIDKVMASLPKEPDTNASAPEKPLSTQEQLLADYKRLLGTAEEDTKALQEARRSDRMLKVGGAIGDALATYINAQGQKRVKAPGVQVQQGAGLGKVADMFATAPEIASDVKGRREALLKQYAELAKGERSKARLTSEEQRAKDADLRARELAKMQIEGNLKVAGIKAGAKKTEKPLTLYQENQIKREAEKDLQKLSTSVTKLGLPTITTAINSLEKKLGMTLEEALKRNTDEDETNDVEVPGYGRLGSLAPDVFVGDESRALRQDVTSLLNPQISKQFGASQTKGEIERFQKEVGSGKGESTSAILRGLSNIKRSAKADLDAVYAGFKPELVNTYKNREGITLDTVKKEVLQGPYGEFYEKDGKKYRWNPSVNKYQLSK